MCAFVSSPKIGFGGPCRCRRQEPTVSVRVPIFIFSMCSPQRVLKGGQSHNATLHHPSERMNEYVHSIAPNFPSEHFSLHLYSDGMPPARAASRGRERCLQEMYSTVWRRQKGIVNRVSCGSKKWQKFRSSSSFERHQILMQPCPLFFAFTSLCTLLPRMRHESVPGQEW